MRISNLPAVGSLLEGGFYAGLIRVGDQAFGVVVAPKNEGEQSEAEWGKRGEDIPNARSFFDGHANTVAMAEAGSELARWALQLNINGFADWYLPSRDELELCYRNLKPTEEENWVYRHGENCSSVPVGYPYTSELPAQTSATAFQNDGEQAFDDTWYWSSTQYSAYRAWFQGFADGLQGTNVKGLVLRARAVRRFLVIQ